MTGTALRHGSLVLLALVLALPWTASSAEVPVVRWLVPADGDAEAWRTAAASTWPGGLSVRRWDGSWPPSPEDSGEGTLPVAYLDGVPRDGVLVIHGHEDGGALRLPLRFPEADDEEAMRSVLLILRSSVEPLAVEDADPEPALLPPPVDVVVEEPPREIRLRGGVAIGASYRPGLGTPSLAPRARLALVLGPLDRSHQLRLALWGGADLAGKASIGGVPVREDEGFATMGLEARFRWHRAQIPLAVGIGARVYRAIRTDRSEYDKPPPQVRPTVLIEAGPSGPLADGLRLEARLALSIELVRGDGGPPIIMDLHAEDQSVILDLVPVRFGIELALDFGEPDPRHHPPAKKSASPAVRPPSAPTPNGEEG